MSTRDSFVAARHVDWTTIPVEHIAEGIERQMIWGERLMVCRLRFAPRVVTAVHSHAHEQITLVERGRVLFIIDGESRTAAAGDVLVFPPHCEHGATMLDEEVVLVDIFSPVREDFLRPVATGPGGSPSSSGAGPDSLEE